ncbi:hypothetical protein B0H17DRAFT_1185120 [Mycena rosella]|uniref:Uncharacterized protein n=1 Tax=Mycena rosella TaxID=1033263 RepID=A0AAD7CT19_MYCRO|nr:hypothetical protein B0H17DRAFT_1185120 [Mycena rosella]
MNERAIRCIRAFGLLEMVTVRGEDWTDPWTFKYRSWMQADSELQSMAKYLRVSGFGWPDGRAITRWSLCFLPGQALDEDYLEIILDQFQPDAASVDDLSLYTDFVFCINSYFAPPSVHNLSQMDKRSELVLFLLLDTVTQIQCSDHCVLLTTLLFENLAKRLTDTKPLALDITREIIDKIAGFTFSSGLLGGDIRGREAVHRFCAVPNVGIPSIVSALRLVRLDQLTLERIATNVNPMANVAWVHSTLEELYALRPSDPTVITDLLQVLVHHGGVPTKISAAALDVILWGISFDVADATAYLVLILPRVHHWFQDGELRPILRDRMMWPILGKAVPRPGYLLLYPEAVQRMVASYISLGDKLSQTQEWKPVIADDLPGWLGTLSRLLSAHGMDEETRQQFCAVLSRVWDVAPTEPRPEKDPECLVMAFQALTDAWDQFDFSNSQGTHRLLALIECTVLTAFCARIVVWPLPTPISVSDHFEEIVMPRLADAVEQAAERLELAQNTFAADQDLLTGAAGLMLTLASIITGELRRELPRAVDEYDHCFTACSNYPEKQYNSKNWGELAQFKGVSVAGLSVVHIQLHSPVQICKAAVKTKRIDERWWPGLSITQVATDSKMTPTCTAKHWNSGT